MYPSEIVKHLVSSDNKETITYLESFGVIMMSLIIPLIFTWLLKDIDILRY